MEKWEQFLEDYIMHYLSGRPMMEFWGGDLLKLTTTLKVIKEGGEKDGSREIIASLKG